MSSCRSGQADGGSIAHDADGLQRHVARALGCPFVGLLEEQGADEPDNGGGLAPLSRTLLRG